MINRKRTMKPLVVVFILFSISQLVFAQSSSHGVITGTIRDAQSGEALAYTNVFLANTTIGDAADDSGEYLLEKIPPGNYQLVISRIGYDMQVHQVRISPRQRLVLNVDLTVKSIPGEEVRVEAEKTNRQWRRHFREFEREFIGSTPNAGQCKIINPEVLSFDRDGYFLVAVSERAIIVENWALGYRLDILLESYRWGLGRGQYIIYPKYSLLTPSSERQQQKWREKRRETFFASMRDFFVEIADGDPFPRYQVQRMKEASLGEFRTFAMDSLRVEPVRGLDEWKRFYCADILRVQRAGSGVSTIELIYDQIDFDTRGNVYPPDGIRLSGFWGELRVADSLPYDYFPDEDD